MPRKKKERKEEEMSDDIELEFSLHYYSVGLIRLRASSKKKSHGGISMSDTLLSRSLSVHVKVPSAYIILC